MYIALNLYYYIQSESNINQNCITYNTDFEN
jgi:hypothetical protein